MEPDRLQPLVDYNGVYHSLRIALNSPKLMRIAAFGLAVVFACPELLRGASMVPVIQMMPVVQSEAETVLEGSLELLIEDSDQGSRTLYFLITADRRIPLRFTSKPQNLTTGARVRVRGRWEADDTLVVTAIERL